MATKKLIHKTSTPFLQVQTFAKFGCAQVRPKTLTPKAPADAVVQVRANFGLVGVLGQELVVVAVAVAVLEVVVAVVVAAAVSVAGDIVQVQRKPAFQVHFVQEHLVQEHLDREHLDQHLCLVPLEMMHSLEEHPVLHDVQEADRLCHVPLEVVPPLEVAPLGVVKELDPTDVDQEILQTTNTHEFHNTHKGSSV